MERKIIKVMKDGKPLFVEMTKEEAIIKFKNMAKEFAYKCVTELSGYKNSYNDFEDYEQLGLIKISKVYDTYDCKRNACFSKVLFNSYRNLFIDLIKANEKKKRKVEDLISLDSSKTFDNGSNSTNHELIEDYSIDLESQIEKDESDLDKFLLSKLDKEDLVYIIIYLKKKINSKDKYEKLSVEYALEVLNIFNIETNRKDVLAKQLGISKPTLNKKINIAVEKMRKLTRDYYKENGIKFTL